MANYAIITDLNRCVGCLACTVACKAINGVPIGNFWIKTLRIGPHPTESGSGHFPDVEMYFLPIQCQHCENPECVHVCPTGASYIREDGTVQIDKVQVHRLPVLRHVLPLRRALPQRGGVRRGEVHALRAEDRPGGASAVRVAVRSARPLLRRP